MSAVYAVTGIGAGGRSCRQPSVSVSGNTALRRSPEAVCSNPSRTGSSNSRSAMLNLIHVVADPVSMIPRVLSGGSTIRPSSRRRSNSFGSSPISTSTTGPWEPMIPETLVYSGPSAVISRYHPWDADHRIFLRDQFDQESPSDPALVTSRASFVLGFKTADELRAAASVFRLNQQRPTTGIGREHGISPSCKVRFKAVKDANGCHRCIVAYLVVQPRAAFAIGASAHCDSYDGTGAWADR